MVDRKQTGEGKEKKRRGKKKEKKKGGALNKKIQLRILYACCYFNYTSQEVLNEKRERKRKSYCFRLNRLKHYFFRAYDLCMYSPLQYIIRLILSMIANWYIHKNAL